MATNVVIARPTRIRTDDEAMAEIRAEFVKLAELFKGRTVTFRYPGRDGGKAQERLVSNITLILDSEGLPSHVHGMTADGIKKFRVDRIVGGIRGMVIL